MCTVRHLEGFLFLTKFPESQIFEENDLKAGLSFNQPLILFFFADCLSAPATQN
jgi:hypothetical protein